MFAADMDQILCIYCKLGKYADDTGFTICKNRTVCQIGTYIYRPSTIFYDTTCENCIQGRYADNQDMPVCKYWSVICGPGFFIAIEPNQTADTVCDSCKPGFYTDGDNFTECIPYTICYTGYTFKGSPTVDTICKACPVYQVRWPNVPTGKCYLCSVWGKFACRWLQFAAFLFLGMSLFLAYSKGKYVVYKLQIHLGLKARPLYAEKLNHTKIVPEKLKRYKGSRNMLFISCKYILV
jgi:hypothetical protein